MHGRIREIEAEVEDDRMSREDGQWLMTETRREIEAVVKSRSDNAVPAEAMARRMSEIEAAVDAGWMSRDGFVRKSVEMRREIIDRDD